MLSKDSGIRYQMQNQPISKRLSALRTLVSICLASLILLQGCSFPGVYKINVQQGNIVTTEMLDQLRPGMTKRQVHFVLGNPVVENVFDENQETYLYSFQEAGGETKTQNVTIFYEAGKYLRHEGQLLDDHPAY